MAEDQEPAPTSIADRIAALKLSTQAGNIPVRAPPSYEQATNGSSTGVANGSASSVQRPRPPPPPRPNRAQTSSVPPVNDQVPDANRPVGNQPERPPLPARTSTQSSQSSQAPPLPSRTPSERPTPSLPPRRPSEAPSQSDYQLSRRGSNESVSSVATARSSVSGISNATSLTSQGGERFKIRAPDFDPSALPALPPKRTKEEVDAAHKKYNGPARPLRGARSASTPKVAQIQEGTTPPPMPVRQPVVQPPALPGRTNSIPTEPRQTVSPAQPARAQPPPPPARQQAPPPPRADPVPPPRPRPSALSYGFNNKADQSTSQPAPAPQSNGAPPPPIPNGSKPYLAALQASKPKLNGNSLAPAPVTAPAPAAGPIAITSYSQFSQILSSHRIVMSDFYADWCGPCRQFAPDYERIAKEYSRPNQIAFIKINTDHNKDIAQTYGIQCWPTLIIFEGGSQVDKCEGSSEGWVTNYIEELASRNNISLSAPVARPVASATPAPVGGACLHCRDFSVPDNHAARFPRQSIPSHDVGWLAQQLTAPFHSHTDKARAIFTWLHHNIAYDTVAFFGNNVRPSTPQGTLQSGLAVCEGYAGLFTALAVKSGLESIVIGGHGKGFGHTALAPGQPAPPRKASGHAWNAVKIDNGEWKLLDACWGAGHLGANQSYNKRFAPERFTQTNNSFGLDHFPEDSSKQFRTDGRIVTWEEYILGNKKGSGAHFFSGYVSEEGLDSTSFQPQTSRIVPSQQPGPTMRFSFQRICPHWDPLRNGKGPPFLYVLHLDALEGDRKQNWIPFETNGAVWWCDVPVQDLGRPGQEAKIGVMKTFGPKDGRGLTIEEYKRRRGTVGCSYGFVCKWDIA